MNKLINITAYLLFFTFNIQLVHAQNSKGTIGILVGPSIPVGDFGSKNYDNGFAGFAVTGATFEIAVDYKLGKGNWGVAATMRGQANSHDFMAYQNELENHYGGVNWFVESDVWTVGGIMLGAFRDFPIDKSISFKPRFLVGFPSASSPNITTTAYGSGNSNWVRSNKAYSRNFGYLLGLGFKFDMSKKLSILANADNFGTLQEFRQVEILNSDGMRSYDTYLQPMNSINLSIGLAVKI
jgi:hypothetical protein